MTSGDHNSSSTSNTLVTSLAVAGATLLLSGGVYYLYKKTTQQITKPEPNRISELNIFPVKSLQGMSVSEWKVGPRGFLYDRQWMIVMKMPKAVAKKLSNEEVWSEQEQETQQEQEEECYKFVTQRQLPRLSLIGARVSLDNETLTLYKIGSSESSESAVSSSGTDQSSKVNGGEISSNFELPFGSFLTANNADKLVWAEIWGKQFKSIDMGDEVADWLSKAANKPGLRLVMAPNNFDRTPGNEFYNEFLTLGEKAPMLQTAFADGFPYLITTENSLDDVNKKLPENNQASMVRFRGNIVVERNGTLQPFEEEYWKQMHLSRLSSDGTQEESTGITLYNVKVCTRCSMPNVNPEVGKLELEGPSYQLSQYHTTQESKNPLFGINIMHSTDSINKVIRVGDLINVDSTWDCPPFSTS